MKTIYKKSIPAGQLPQEWQAEGQFAVDQEVTVWIEPSDPELAAAISVSDLMETIGRRAQARGLTEEKLATILYE